MTITRETLTAAGLQLGQLEWIGEHRLKADVYSIHESYGQGPKAYFLSRGNTIIGWFDSQDEAKAAAQADYETRFLAALEPIPDDVPVDPVAEAVDGIRSAVLAADDVHVAYSCGYRITLTFGADAGNYTHHFNALRALSQKESGDG